MTSSPMAVLISSCARIALDDVINRTHRPITLLVQHAIADLACAYASDPTVIDAYSAGPGRREDGRRISFHPSPGTADMLTAMHEHSGVRTAGIVRAAWMRWLDVRGVDAIAAEYGIVHPGSKRAMGE